MIADAVIELSDFFGVSVQSAKIRMIDVGYTEAIGVFEYVDDRYVPAYSFENGAAGKNQTFSIPVLDSAHQYVFNADFQRLVDSGNFVYIDAHYCINDPKYVTANKYGILEMTGYAVKHIDECCLIFDRSTRPNDNFGVQRYTECILFQSAVSRTVTEYKYSHNDHNRDIASRAAVMLAEYGEVKAAVKIMEQLPATFHQSLIALMKWRGVTNEQLAEKSLLSPKTIQRMRTNPDYKCDIRTLVAVCIGLQLPSYVSTDLIEKAGIKIKIGVENMTYAHILSTYSKSTIFEANEYLEVAGYPPLSGSE